MSLLNKVSGMPRLPKIPSVLIASLFKYLSSTQVPKVPLVRKCWTTIWVLACLKCSSSKLSWVDEFPSSALSEQWYPFSALQVSKCSSISLRIKAVYSISENGILHCFTDCFKSFLEYIFCMTLIIDASLDIRCVKFNNLGVSKTFFKFFFFESSQKSNTMDFKALFFVKF